MKARLAYFERWIAPVATDVLARNPSVELVRLDGQDAAGNWAALPMVHGYQAATNTDASTRPQGRQWLPDAAFIGRCPNLLAVCVAGAGYDNVDVEACTRAGLIVCNQAGAGRESVAEHALGFMLALSKKIGVADKTIRRRSGWTQVDFKGNDLRGKTVGIIGFGQIGSRLGEMCRLAFSMRVLAFDPYLSAQEIAARGGEKTTLDELLSQSDFVSLNGPLSSETAGQFGTAQFAQMKPGAFFVTTSRGGVHDEAALIAALESGRLGGAGVDVFTQEPPPTDHPLFRFDNVLATPHTAGITHESTHDIAEATAHQWLSIFDGSVPPRLINPEAWPRYADRFEKIFGKRPASPG